MAWAAALLGPGRFAFCPFRSLPPSNRSRYRSTQRCRTEKDVRRWRRYLNGTSEKNRPVYISYSPLFQLLVAEPNQQIRSGHRQIDKIEGQNNGQATEDLVCDPKHIADYNNSGKPRFFLLRCGSQLILPMK